jgi:hypothetical protein
MPCKKRLLSFCIDKGGSIPRPFDADPVLRFLAWQVPVPREVAAEQTPGSARLLQPACSGRDFHHL